MSEAPNDTAVIFDLGKVLVDYDYQHVVDFLYMQGAGYADEKEFARRTRFDLYESGKISDRQFFESMLAQTREPFSFDEWARVWTGIFTPMTDMLALFDVLALHHPTFVLSNIGPLHFNYLDRRVRLTERCHGVLTSWQAGVMKPDARIYAIAQQRFGLTAGQIVFVDDREDNVAAARAAGWRATRHESLPATVAALRSLGVAAP